MRAPFPYFGGKSKVADAVWSALGADIPNYIEPFAGSAAILLARPGWKPDVPWIETINDADGMVSNFWRAVQAKPEAVARYADWPVNENDLHARHLWLAERRSNLTTQLEGDPDYYDARIAGWWVWGMCCWIGGGFCDGNGPWHREQDDEGHDVLVNGDTDLGIERRLASSRSAGIQRRLVHLGGAGRGVCRPTVIVGAPGDGDAGDGTSGLYAWFDMLSQRLRRVRVCSGDWQRVCSSRAVTTGFGTTGVFLDPPYSDAAGRRADIYATDDLTVAHTVRDWCLVNGRNPLLRIVLCGYRGEHDELEGVGWTVHNWQTSGGYGCLGNGVGRANALREVLWLSPNCLPPVQQRLL